MLLGAIDANNILHNTISAVTEEGKKILGSRWNNMTGEEREGFSRVCVLMAKAKIGDMAGNAETADIVKTLTVAFREWELAGQTEFIIVAKEVGKIVLNIAIPIGTTLLRAALM